MLPSFFTTNRIIKDPFNLSPLRSDIVDKLRQRMDEDKKAISPEQDFGNLLLKALDDVNTLQLEPERLNEKMLTAPNSVDIHDITLASAKATLSLSITKELMDRAIRAYKEIINVR
jgi:flagellar hook-basal body complex protein FliE